MSHAKYRSDGTVEHAAAAVDDSGRLITIGYDDIENVTKVAMMVWNPDLLAWERSTGSTSSGTTTEAVSKTKRIDVVSSTLIYIGTAAIGTAESSTGWLVQKITFDASANPTAVYLGSGVWNNRAALSYT